MGNNKDTQNEHVNDPSTNTLDNASVFPNNSDLKPVSNYLSDIENKVITGNQTPGIPTGFPSLDDVLGGGLHMGLYIIGAISSLGKTTFACQIADQIAALGKDVIILSLEMSRYELILKSISRMSAIYTSNLKSDSPVFSMIDLLNHSAKIDEHSNFLKICFDAYREVGKHIYVYEGSGDIDVKRIQSVVQRHIKNTGRTPVVIIDYIQILAPSGKNMTDKQNIDKTVTDLRQLCRTFNSPIIGISSLNRMSYNDCITMAAFKESGSIEYSADVLIGLQLAGVGTKDFDVVTAKQKSPREIEVVILKNRNGPIKKLPLMHFYPAGNLFCETASSASVTSSSPLVELFQHEQIRISEEELPF